MNWTEDSKTLLMESWESFLSRELKERFEQQNERWAEFHRENRTFDFAKTKCVKMKGGEA